MNLAAQARTEMGREMPDDYRAGRVGVYGNPRGGLALALALAHRLDLPMLVPGMTDACEWPCLWVDDIIETGRALRRDANRFPQRIPLAWVFKPRGFDGGGELPLYHQRAEADQWVIFPWEDPERAEADMRRYLADYRYDAACDPADVTLRGE